MNQKTGRNDPCPCNSGKKYKQCCLQAHEDKRRKKFSAKVISNVSSQMTKNFFATHKKENP